MRSFAQIVGVVMAAAGAALLWSPWALVAGGVLLLVGPEVLALRDLRAARTAAAASTSTKGGERS